MLDDAALSRALFRIGVLALAAVAAVSTLTHQPAAEKRKNLRPIAKWADHRGHFFKPVDFKFYQRLEPLCTNLNRSKTVKNSCVGSILLQEGIGFPPQPGEQVRALYAGYLKYGIVFDNSWNHGDDFSFGFRTMMPTLGKPGEAIVGWDYVLGQMRTYERRLIVIPADFGYGHGSHFLANKTLFFYVQRIPYDCVGQCALNAGCGYYKQCVGPYYPYGCRYYPYLPDEHDGIINWVPPPKLTDLPTPKEKEDPMSRDSVLQSCSYDD